MDCPWQPGLPCVELTWQISRGTNNGQLYMKIDVSHLKPILTLYEPSFTGHYCHFGRSRSQIILSLRIYTPIPLLSSVTSLPLHHILRCLVFLSEPSF